jgi:hypothetical protein
MWTILPGHGAGAAGADFPCLQGKNITILPRLGPDFHGIFTSHGNSNRCQIVEEAFFDILDPG